MRYPRVSNDEKAGMDASTLDSGAAQVNRVRPGRSSVRDVDGRFTVFGRVISQSVAVSASPFPFAGTLLDTPAIEHVAAPQVSAASMVTITGSPAEAELRASGLLSSTAPC